MKEREPEAVDAIVTQCERNNRPVRRSEQGGAIEPSAGEMPDDNKSDAILSQVLLRLDRSIVQHTEMHQSVKGLARDPVGGETSRELARPCDLKHARGPSHEGMPIIRAFRTLIS